MWNRWISSWQSERCSGVNVLHELKCAYLASTVVPLRVGKKGFAWGFLSTVEKSAVGSGSREWKGAKVWQRLPWHPRPTLNTTSAGAAVNAFDISRVWKPTTACKMMKEIRTIIVFVAIGMSFRSLRTLFKIQTVKSCSSGWSKCWQMLLELALACVFLWKNQLSIAHHSRGVIN